MNTLSLPLLVSLVVVLVPKRISYLISAVFSFLPLFVVMSMGGDINIELFKDLTISLGQTPLGNFFGYIVALSAPLALIASASKKDDKIFYSLFHLLIFSLLVIVYAKDLITFFVGWEIMTWSSYFLLARNSEACYNALQKYILFALASAFTLIGAIVVSYSLTGSLLISENITYLSSANTTAVNLAYGLFLVSFLIKLGTCLYTIG